MRLQVAISRQGVASRRKAASIIEQGIVTVNGKIIRERGYAVNPDTDDIAVGGKELKSKTKKIYILLNKPKGVITSKSDPEERETVFDLLPRALSRLHSVGRLDKDTTGLLLLTNDGELTYRLTHPRFEVRKRYKLTCERKVVEKKVHILERGMYIDGRKTAPAKIEIIRSDENRTELFIEIHEGRKRQIRNMFLFLGHPIKNLERVSYEFLQLGNTRRGDFRHLTSEEVRKLKAL
ncbi:MAG: rRNA pseudouridine synthase [Candidatus Omnitrophica bacterium]|nr:rRNA pseudouridine synthase [Candidatus Omnitrophota bacterium]MBU4488774.1 rRNA pseudouridine synthase [Candidatus Omnitrophota bacterium]MCG2705871.1 rRNA pseudouridine synthase [Candidatus Omnitrophota bacterium]